MPKSAGEATYVETAFARPALSAAVGWGVILTGIVSSATLVRGFVGYLDVFLVLPVELVVVVTVVALAALAAWGISESMRVAGFITLVEALGLLGVCFLARDSLAAPPDRWLAMLPGLDAATWIGVGAGAFIAFYAFIGFEDMVNVAEEVVEPERTIPRAVIAALVISTSLYAIVGTVASLALPVDALAASDAPMASIVESRGHSPVLIAVIGLFAVVNGALIQIVMASRVLYGMGAQGLAWHRFASVHPVLRTPVVATIAVAVTILALSATLAVGELAQLTSFVALSIFTAVNVSLIAIKRTATTAAAFAVPMFVPVVGALLSGGMLVARLASLVAAGVR